MRVLVIASGARLHRASAVVANQMESIKELGVDFDYLLISRPSYRGYLEAIPKIKAASRNKNYDLIHAHYSLCGYSAALAMTGLPIICSLMGSDLSTRTRASMARFFAKYIWKRTIVKSNDMLQALKTRGKIFVIPNGVNIERFRPWNDEPQATVFPRDVDNVLFLAGIQRKEKNFSLARQAVDLIKGRNVGLRQVEGIDPERVPDYIRSADLVLLTSFREGSPNVVKEALACNVPVVTTDVGDVRKLLSGVRACYVADFDPSDVAAKIQLALDDKNWCDGREAIKRLSLDSVSVANKILDLYQSCLVDE